MKKYLEHLKKGKILLIPFDTVWGLAGDAQNYQTVKTIFEIKKRSLDKPIAILLQNLVYIKTISGERKIEKKTNIIKNIIKKYLPGAYTLLIKTNIKPNLSPPCFKIQNSEYILGLRLIDQKYLIQKIATAYNQPLTATSANFSGQESIFNAKKAREFYNLIPEKYKKRIVFIDSKEECSGKLSQIIDLTHKTPKKIER
ncbi:MAG: tRNA threonylcarbamoyladenosine biosynthesis protein [Candidatus Berkelbacteria bacterium Licking1014_7]|uniref:L-threonylcarbamoyladenylate synthase n=1 Tax=Candidatus Berkelbacteria bacterium Licking1014_7 TaxID=2017147 RepID=A0A554LJ66_9BACT|nr:MAG: tRNA threonylcarbamoyladenosine biosynthesis protein [Candidatus Berkelbacteria bacterium Licking1014_7]